jgi:hypothetical protein
MRPTPYRLFIRYSFWENEKENPKTSFQQGGNISLLMKTPHGTEINWGKLDLLS